MAKEPTIPSTVKFPPETLRKLKEAAELTGLPMQEIIRMCAGIGLIHLKKINFDIHGTIYKATSESAEIIPMSLDQVAESKQTSPLAEAPRLPTKYPAKKRAPIRPLDKPADGERKAN